VDSQGGSCSKGGLSWERVGKKRCGTKCSSLHRRASLLSRGVGGDEPYIKPIRVGGSVQSWGWTRKKPRAGRLLKKAYPFHNESQKKGTGEGVGTQPPQRTKERISKSGPGQDRGGGVQLVTQSPLGSFAKGGGLTLATLTKGAWI